MKVSANRIDMQRARIDQAQLKDVGYTKNAPAISSGTLTLDISTGNVFEVSLTQNVTTLNITNPAPSGQACTFDLIFTAAGNSGAGSARKITWPSSVQWAGGGQHHL